MTRLELFAKAQAAVDSLALRFGEGRAIHSIRLQLEYLTALASNEHRDASRLEEIIIGVLTVREIEALDVATAELLYDVDEEVEKMKRERNRSLR